ncbi:MAG: histidinol-phosphate transaminase [Anaerolineales bacterium]|nr:histidinol-phosphate transaminase [Anaerolineales bacterium]
MTKKLNFIRQHILDLPAYQPIFPLDVLAEELGIDKNQLNKLDANENPFGPLPEVKEVLSEIDSYHIYPDPESRQIRNLLAEHHNLPQECIVIGAGADELIDLIMRIVLDPGDKIVNCPPTFGMYAFDGLLNRAEVISIPRNPDFSLNLPALISAVEIYQPKLMFLANPNNPDGSTISEDDFVQLVNLPILLVIDEAYIQFSDPGQTLIPQISDYPNLIVLRTFSKWAGLAGLRIGYGVFPAEMTPVLMKAKQPYNVSVAAEAAAVITMKHLSKAEERVAKIIEQRNQLLVGLAQIPWLSTYPSQANFILCKVMHRSAREVRDGLRNQGVLVRYFDKPGLSDHIRISIGTEEQNQQLLCALKGMSKL